MTERAKAIISAAVILIVELAGMFNLTLDSSLVETIFTAAIMVAIIVFSIWKNHNFTDAASVGQALVGALKKSDVDTLEVVKQTADEYIAKHLSENNEG